MLLEELNKIIQRGAEKPLFLWQEEFKTISQPAIDGLKELLLELHQETEAGKNVQNLVGLLEQNSPNELKLAKALLYVSDLFREEMPSEHQELINNYIQGGMKFYNNAQLSEFHRQTREKMKAALAPDKQREYDLRLFQHEGMMYCLEYYLAIYKSIVDAKTEAEKKRYIEDPTINLGFGDVLGLWIDFSRDEVLGKFIYAILDDEVRSNLSQAYFFAKMEIMKIKLVCWKKGGCQGDFQSTNLASMVEAFRRLIGSLLVEYQKIGVDRLSSFFFKSYGNKPLIRDVLNSL
jgi:hypothetical protein